MTNNYLESIKKQFEYYKILGEKTLVQVQEDKFSWQFNEESNSIATIVKHLSGNMLSRWTDFLTKDGEKEWRDRDLEFDNAILSRQELMHIWNSGWDCLFNALNSLTQADLLKEVYIRKEGHTVIEALNRQLAHYCYHVGQIVFLGKMICNESWATLSIAKGKSSEFNKEKFARSKNSE